MAGTPLVSDPGYKLVREAAGVGANVVPVPGASALLAGLAVAGLPTDRFMFAGFPPTKRGPRRALFEELTSVRTTLIFYETGPRLADSLADMAAVFGADRDAAVARELTKFYETCYRGTLGELAVDPKLQAPKGEIVVLVGPGHEAVATPEDADRALADALTRLGPADAATEVASTATSAFAAVVPSGRRNCIATPVDVSLWVSAYRSMPSSTAGSGWVPVSDLTMVGSPRCGAFLTPSANFAPNSPKVRCWLRCSISECTAESQNVVAPPLASRIS